MQALIVTCYRDTWHFRLQCESIAKYLEPCDLHIVINEPRPEYWISWFDTNIKPLLANHNVTVYRLADFYTDLNMVQILSYSGWITQQIFKLVFALKTDAPYIVLDSKNWFVKPTKLADVPRPPRNALPSEVFVRFYYGALKKLDLQPIKYCQEITPFFIEPGVVRSMIEWFGGIDRFITWFVSFDVPSEFIIYDLFAQKIGFEFDVVVRPGYCKTFWVGETVSASAIQQALDDPQVHLIGVQHALLKQLNTDEVEAVLNIS